MESRIKFKQLILILLALQCAYSSNNTVYFVYPLGVDCQLRSQCHSLYYYGTDILKPHENNTVTMILFGGNHSTLDSVYNFGSPENSHTLHVKADSQSSKPVVINELKGAITVKNMILEGFTASKIYIYIDESVVNSQITDIMIINCTFINSAMILTNVHLTIINSTFSDSSSTAIMLFSSTLTIMGNVSFRDNRGYQGGALMLAGTVMNIARETNLLFQENHAENTGGAIFVVYPQTMIDAHDFISLCFYQLLDYDSYSAIFTYSIKFVNNSAAKGGDHIYGASLKSSCICALNRNEYNDNNSIYSHYVFNQVFTFDPWHKSAVSADATRVCICDDSGLPQCDTGLEYLQAYPGEQFSLQLVVVGGDYGTTTGNVYTYFLNQNESVLGSSDQQHQAITENTECNRFNYSVHSNKSRGIIILLLTTQSDNMDSLFIVIELLPCPPGFVVSGNPSHCLCHPVLTTNGIHCMLNHLKGYHSWKLSNIWIQAIDNKHKQLLFSKHCSFGYCKPDGKHINLSNPDSQCALNRAGILCGGCKTNFSLAIGSSHCIHCPNNNNLALLIFFAAAGVLLILIIAVLNLTVTHGMINGLIFYANLIWAYQSILLPSDFGRELIVHKTFIAWLNLDFGIETCFFRGMNAYSKAWLQFVFPFYTAGLFLLGLRYSSKLSKLFESRSISTLATLLFLSYSKLLRAIIACLQLVTYYTYNDSNIDRSINIVWAIDGNYSYGRHPHIYLLLAAIACFILLWIPYTLLLFSMQWLRSVDHFGPLKFIGRYKPLYDAYFAPLKDKHHYWFGLLLLSQGLLLLVSSLTLYSLPEISVLLLLAISIFLLCYVISVRPYKHMSIALLESSFMINFIVLAIGYLYFRDNKKGMMILLSLSITAALVEFCGIVVWNLIPKTLIERFHAKIKRNAEVDSDDIHILEEHHSESEYVSYQESQSIKLANVAAEKAT